MTLVTGSKFYEGPPFSGAAIFPNAMAIEVESHLKSYKDEIASKNKINSNTNKNKNLTTPTKLAPGSSDSSICVCAVPKGLSDYITPYDVCANMPYLREYVRSDSTISSGSDSITTQWYNAGSILRWTVGLNSMEEYSALLPDDVNNFTKNWVTDVKKMISDGSPHLSLLEVTEGIAEGYMIGDINSIISFGVNIIEYNVYRQLNFEEMKIFHRKMTQALPVPNSAYVTALKSSTVPIVLDRKRMKAVLEIPIMLGQPVKLAEFGGDSGSSSISSDDKKENGSKGEGERGSGGGIGCVVRIALGATMVIDALNPLKEMQSHSLGDKVHGVSPVKANGVIKDENNKIDNVMKTKIDDALIVEKMLLIAKNWYEVTDTSPPPLPSSLPSSPLPTTPTPTKANRISDVNLSVCDTISPNDLTGKSMKNK